jgi:hypothetical protein
MKIQYSFNKSFINLAMEIESNIINQQQANQRRFRLKIITYIVLISGAILFGIFVVLAWACSQTDPYPYCHALPVRTWYVFAWCSLVFYIILAGGLIFIWVTTGKYEFAQLK